MFCWFAPQGLVVPVLRSVEGMSYLDIEKGIEALGAKAKAGELTVTGADRLLSGHCVTGYRVVTG